MCRVEATSWFGHSSRVPDTRPPARASHNIVHRPVGAQAAYVRVLSTYVKKPLGGRFRFAVRRT